MPLSVPLRTPPRCQLDQVAAGRSLDSARVFRYRAIREMHETRGGYSMMVAIGVDTPLGKSL